MRPSSCVALLAAAVAGPALAGAPPTPTLYGLEKFGDLLTIDALTGEVLTTVDITLPGFDVYTCNGLARHPSSGALYAVVRAQSVDGPNPNYLVTLDRATGVATPIGNLGDDFAGLAFLPNGSLIGVTGDGATVRETLFHISPSTAATGFIARLGNGSGGEAIAAMPDGFLYHASGDGADEQFFERVNLAGAGGLTDILTGHSYGQDEVTLALGWSDVLGKMFGADGGEQNLFTIDLQTGAKTTVGPLGGMRIKGLAFDGATLFALENNSPPYLHTIDPADGQVLTTVSVDLEGHFFGNGTALARRPATGALYAVVRESPAGASSGLINRLVTVDPATGAATLIGDLAHDFAALAFRADGALLGVTGAGADVPKALFRIDLTTAATTFQRDLPSAASGGQALAAAPDGFFYHAAGDEIYDQVFEKFDPNLSLPPFLLDIPRLSLHSFPGGDSAVAMVWSSAANAMLFANADRELFTLGTASPAFFQDVGGTSRRLNGMAFDGATLFGACADCPTLYKLDPSGATIDARTVSVAGILVADLYGLAMHPTNGLLYAIVRSTNASDRRFLCTFNPVTFTGVGTNRGQLSDRFAGLAFRPNGTLIGVTAFAATNSNKLYTINTTNANASLLMSLVHGDQGSGQAIAIAPDDFLYHAAGDQEDSQFYERIDLDTQAVTVIDTPSYSHTFPYTEATAMGYSPGLDAMYLADDAGQLWTMNLVTGEPTYIGNIQTALRGPAALKGLVFDEPVPQPCQGDANGDGVVDFVDLNIVLTAYGQVGFGLLGDLDHDGDVDFADLNIVLTAYATIC